jgi:hypothetical protein
MEDRVFHDKLFSIQFLTLRAFHISDMFSILIHRSRSLKINSKSEQKLDERFETKIMAGIETCDYGIKTWHYLRYNKKSAVV